VEEVLVIILELNGVVFCFPMFKPSQEEFDTCDRSELTFEILEYYPSTKKFREQEAGIMDSWVRLKVSEDLLPKQRQVCTLRQRELVIKKLTVKYSDTSAKFQYLSFALHDSTLLAELNHNASTPDLNVSSMNVTMRDKGGFDAETLAKNWGIGIEVTKTQRGIRNMIHPNLTKWYKKNYRQMWYRRLPVTMLTDAMYSTIFSRQGNKAAQVFLTDFGFVRAFPMKRESEAHEALYLLLHRDGVPNVMVMDGYKTQVEGEFRMKLYDAGCHIKQTEPHMQSSNMGEGGVCELKRGVGRQMLRSACPKKLWDDCIIRVAYVRSHTSIDIFGLEGQVPQSKVKGENVDISTIAEYAWYERVKLRDTATKLPVSMIQLGRDLGAAIDIGPSMARKIMKKK
jgi:hypothetical protein